MRYRTFWYAYLSATLAVAALALPAGCARQQEDVSIPPLPSMEGRSNPGLGPGTQPISSGPGYKGSPSWGPEGNRIAFTMDGYVADAAVGTGELRRRTTRDFGAEEAVWTSGDDLAILGAPVGDGGASRSLYRTTTEEGSLGVDEIAPGVRAMSADPEDGSMVVALEAGPNDSRLALLADDGKIKRIYTSAIGGAVTGLSLSPDGKEAVLAVRAGGPYGPYDLHVFDLRTGDDRRIASLGAGQEIFGAPQSTGHGIYYVSGEGRGSRSGETALYGLYRMPAHPKEGDLPEPAPGVGEDFVAAGVRVSPDGERLAVIGRLNPKSPLNLYVLDLTTENLVAVTTNEDMEIKTGSDDLDWSPRGDSVAIVARGAPSGEPSVRAAPSETLLEDFYNLYEVPVGVPAGGGPR
jgi:Tol biopolymer transport system component